MNSKKIFKCEYKRFILDKRMSISFFAIVLTLLILMALYSILMIVPQINKDENIDKTLSESTRDYLEDKLNEYKSKQDGTYTGMLLPNETDKVIQSKISYYAFLLENNINPEWFYKYSDNLFSNSFNYGTNEMFLWLNVSMMLMFIVSILLPIYSIGIEKEKDRIKNLRINNILSRDIHIGKLSFYYTLIIGVWFVQMIIGLFIGLQTPNQQVLLQFGLQYKSVNCVAWYFVEEVVVLFVMLALYSMSYIVEVYVRKMKIAIVLTLLIPIILFGLSYLLMVVLNSFDLYDFFANVFLTRTITADILIIIPIALISTILYILAILKIVKKDY